MYYHIINALIVKKTVLSLMSYLLMPLTGITVPLFWISYYFNGRIFILMGILSWFDATRSWLKCERVVILAGDLYDVHQPFFWHCLLVFNECPWKCIANYSVEDNGMQLTNIVIIFFCIIPGTSVVSLWYKVLNHISPIILWFMAIQFLKRRWKI